MSMQSETSAVAPELPPKTAAGGSAQQILLGCPHLAADVRQGLNAAQQAEAAAESSAASVDSGIGSIAT